MTAPEERSRRPVRSRTHPSRKPEPDLHQLLGLARIDTEALARAEVLHRIECRFAYHEALAYWLNAWRRLDDHRQYVVMHGFVAVVTYDDVTRSWSWSAARELQRGAQRGPRLAGLAYYDAEPAAKIAVYDFVAELLAAEARGRGEAR
jgi:hypothetical protein